MQILHKTSEVGGRPVALYNLDVVISMSTFQSATA